MKVGWVLEISEGKVGWSDCGGRRGFGIIGEVRVWMNEF